MEPSEYKEVVYTVEDGVGLITLNRPQALNAFTPTMWAEWYDAMDRARKDPKVGTLVVTGAGRGFCAGADLSGKPGTPHPIEWAGEKALHQRISLLLSQGYGAESPFGIGPHDLVLLADKMDKPYIGAVNGVCVGGGMGFASICDWRIASERATFGETYVRIGTFASNGCAYLLPRIVGLPKALELLLTGDIIDAQEALRIGYVSRVVPHDQLMPITMELAQRLARGPWSQRLLKKMVCRLYNMDMRSALEFTALSSAITHISEDAAEGRKAWREKRKPQYKGR